MRLRTTLILFLICAGLGGYLYFFDQKLPTTDELQEKSKLVFQVKSSDVEKLQFQTAGSQILCERKENTGQWWVTQPLNAKADPSTIDTLLSRLESLEKWSDLGKAQSSDYGLQSPQNEILFWVRGKQEKLSFGNKAAIGNQRYAAAGDGTVFLIDEGSVGIFNKELFDFRDKTLLEGSVPQVTEITVRKNGGVVAGCKKDDKGNWKIEQSASYRGDQNRIEDFIRECTGLKASQFVMEQAADLVSLGLQPPEGEISLWREGQTEPQRLLIGKNPEGKEDFYAKLENQPNIVLVGAGVKNILRKEIIALRDKRLFTFDEAQLKRLEWVQGEQSWKFERKEGKWDPEKVQNAVKQLTWMTFLMLASAPNESDLFPSDQVKVLKGWGENSEPLFIFTVGKRADEAQEYYYGKVSGSDEIYILSAGQVENLLALIPSQKSS